MKNALAFRSAFSMFLRSRLGAAGVEFALLLPMAAFVLAVALESARAASSQNQGSAIYLRPPRRCGHVSWFGYSACYGARHGCRVGQP